MITALMIALAPATPELAPTAPLAPLDDALISIMQDAEAAPQWTGSVAMSAITTSGNTEQESFNFDAGAVLRRDVDRFTWKSYLNYATDSSSGTSTLTQRKMGTSLKYDYFVNEAETTYLFANTGAEYDALADLDLRAKFGGGLGYQFWEKPESKLSGEVGVNYFIEDYEGGQSDEYAALRLAADSFEQLNEDLTWATSAEVYPSLENKDDVTAKLDTKLSLSLTETMFSSLQYVMDYDNTPNGANDRVDSRIVLALGWSF
ncbi:MAG: DUF481 domain-containing protein [Planctomycetota bacterium]|nr:DUF481 domain-containing protein [Planctomycetota bacterium]